MSWPFSNVGAPTIDSGWVTLTNAYANVPNVAAATLWVLGIFVNNPTGAEILFSLEDASANVILPAVSIPSGAGVPIELPFLPVAGIPQWKGSASGLVAKLWGYQ